MAFFRLAKVDGDFLAFPDEGRTQQAGGGDVGIMNFTPAGGTDEPAFFLGAALATRSRLAAHPLTRLPTRPQ